MYVTAQNCDFIFFDALDFSFASSTSKNTKRQKTAKGDESQTDSENESSSEMQTTFKRPRNKNSVTVEEMLKNFKRILKLQLEMIGNDYLQAEIRMVVAAYACNSIRKSLKNEKLSSESSALKEIDGFEDAPNLIVDNEGSSERNDLFVNFLAAEIKGIGKAIIQKKIMSRVQQRIATLVANVFDNSDIDTASTVLTWLSKCDTGNENGNE